MVISAPTTTASPGSMMRPVTEALVLCADNAVLLQRRQAEEKRARMILLLIFNYKLIQLPNSRREPRRHLPQRAQNSSFIAHSDSGVVRRSPQRREQELFAARLLLAAPGLHGHKHGVNLIQDFGIVKAQGPAFVGGIVQVEHAHVQRTLVSRATSSPGLKSSIVHSRLAIQVKSVEDQRFPCGVEDSSKGFLGFSFAINIEHVGNIEIACSHQITDVTVRYQKFLCALDRVLAFFQARSKLVYTRLEACRAQELPAMFCLQSIEPLLSCGQGILCFL